MFDNFFIKFGGKEKRVETPPEWVGEVKGKCFRVRTVEHVCS